MGGSDYSQTVQDAVNYATEQGVIVIGAVGNDGSSIMQYPASCDGVTGVGATNNLDTRASFSQYNQSVDVVAPGESVLTTISDTLGYGYVSGTSFSAPHVLGVAALAVSVNPSLTPFTFINTLKETSTDLGPIGRDNYYGYGRVNAYAAIQNITINSFTANKASP